jgi:hypothetical protein
LFSRAAAALLVLLGAGTANAANVERVNIEYVPPKSNALKPVYEYLREAKALERIQDLLSPLLLPRKLLIKTEGCNGESNAWYQDDAVTLCYEFVDDIWKNAAKKKTVLGLAPIDTLLGPFVDVVLHEVGHALFDILRIPVFGREEDAADQFSAYIMLLSDKADARRLILGNAWQYKNDLRRRGPPPALKSYADIHGTSAQRFFNVLCIAYGADEDLFKDVVEQKYLPKERAEGCSDEYHQVRYAFENLIGPHIDGRRASAMKSYLPPSYTKMKKRPQASRAN